MATGVFGKLADVKSNTGGVWFLPGNYLVKIRAVKLIDTLAGHQSFVIEGTVVESDNPERSPGTPASQVIALKPAIMATAMSNVKNFMGAALAIADPDSYVPDEGTVEDFWNATGEYFISEKQPLAGKNLYLSCTTIKTKKGEDFTKHTWMPYEEDDSDGE